MTRGGEHRLTRVLMAPTRRHSVPIMAELDRGGRHLDLAREDGDRSGLKGGESGG